MNSDLAHHNWSSISVGGWICYLNRSKAAAAPDNNASRKSMRLHPSILKPFGDFPR